MSAISDASIEYQMEEVSAIPDGSRDGNIRYQGPFKNYVILLRRSPKYSQKIKEGDPPKDRIKRKS